MARTAPALLIAALLVPACTAGPWLDRCVERCGVQRDCVGATSIVSCEQACRAQQERDARTGCEGEADGLLGCAEGRDGCSTAGCNDEAVAWLACLDEGAASDPCLAWCEAADADCPVDGGVGCVAACNALDAGARALGCLAEWQARVACEGAAADVCAPAECDAEVAAYEACLDRFCAELPAFAERGLIDCPGRG